MAQVSERFCQACIAGDTQSVKEMLTKDASLANANGMVRADHREYMKKHGSEGGWSALHLAAHYGQLEIVKLLVNAGADLNAHSKNGEANTPLMAAVAGGQKEIVSVLVRAGADPLKTDASGKFNALKLAEVDQKPEIVSLVKTLLQR